MLNMSKNTSYSDSQEFIKLSQSYEKGYKISFDKNCPVYTFTTENLSYIKCLDVKNKKVLTVTSSGDQLLNLIFLGANKVDCFDLNVNTYYYTKLKIAAIKTLTYEEFLTYFCFCEEVMIRESYSPRKMIPIEMNEDCLNYNLYKKIRKNLEEDVLLFFDEIYSYYIGINKKLMKCKMFNHSCMIDSINNNEYLMNEQNYYETRKKLDEVEYSFYNTDIFDIHCMYSKYDVIILSNIYDYIVLDKNKNELFMDYVFKISDKLLLENGKIVVTYQYGYRSKTSFARSLSVNVNAFNSNNNYKIDENALLKEYELEIIVFPAAIQQWRKELVDDCVYIYKKEKGSKM